MAVVRLGGKFPEQRGAARTGLAAQPDLPTRSFTYRGTTHAPIANGPANIFLPKPSGRRPHEALMDAHSHGATTGVPSEPIAAAQSPELRQAASPPPEQTHTAF